MCSSIEGDAYCWGKSVREREGTFSKYTVKWSQGLHLWHPDSCVWQIITTNLYSEKCAATGECNKAALQKHQTKKNTVKGLFISI